MLMIYSYTLPQSHTVFPPCLVYLEYKSNAEASTVSSLAEFNFSTHNTLSTPQAIHFFETLVTLQK